MVKTLVFLILIICLIVLIYFVYLTIVVHWEKQRGLYHPDRYRVYIVGEWFVQHVLLSRYFFIALLITVGSFVYFHFFSTTGFKKKPVQSQVIENIATEESADSSAVDSSPRLEEETMEGFIRRIEARRSDLSKTDFCDILALEMRLISSQKAALSGMKMKHLSRFWVKGCD